MVVIARERILTHNSWGTRSSRPGNNAGFVRRYVLCAGMHGVCVCVYVCSREREREGHTHQTAA